MNAIEAAISTVVAQFNVLRDSVEVMKQQTLEAQNSVMSGGPAPAQMPMAPPPPPPQEFSSEVCNGTSFERPLGLTDAF